jgi:hypothetical protein
MQRSDSAAAAFSTQIFCDLRGYLMSQTGTVGAATSEG